MNTNYEILCFKKEVFTLWDKQKSSLSQILTVGEQLWQALK